MFGHVYFASRYFPNGYFPAGTDAAVKPRYFHHSYFAGSYFPDRYFPGNAPVAVKPRYFLHSYFAARMFADRYFPGDFVTVEPPPVPEPTIVTGGAALVRTPQHISAVLDLEVPLPLLDALGLLRDDVRGQTALTLGAPVVAAIGTATPAHLLAQWAIQMDSPILEVSGWADKPRRVPTRSDEDEENLLLEHYLRSLKGS